MLERLRLNSGTLVIVALGGTACGGGAHPSPRSASGAPGVAQSTPSEERLLLTEDPSLLLEELEGLAFVPAGRTFIGSALDVGSPVDLLVDRYEVWNARWLQWTAKDNPIPAEYRPAQPFSDPRPRPEAWDDQVPATGMTLDEARTFAEKRSMRILTCEEWLWCAVGPTCRLVPAGRRQRGFANTLETKLYHATPVGAFESGQTPVTGIYDMLGNVWEWIEPPSDRMRDWSVPIDSAWSADAGFEAPTWVLGGSFMTPDSLLHTRDGRLMALATTEGHRSNQIGLRCCVDADIYLASLPPGAPMDTERRRRLGAVGVRWGPRAAPLLEDLLQARPGHRWLPALLEGARRHTRDGARTRSNR